MIRLGLHHAEKSLTRRFLGGIVAPMAVLALLLAVGGTWVIKAAVETVNDRILSAAAHAIAESLGVENGQITLDLSPAIFGMLEDNARDNVYYSVRRGAEVVTGYAGLPDIAPHGVPDKQVVFGQGVYRGMPVRIIAEGHRLPHIADPVVVVVAETLGAREHVTQRLQRGLILLEVILVGCAAVLLPMVVRWGMKPIVALGREMDNRATLDMTPLAVGDLPQEMRDLGRAFNRMLERLDASFQNMRRFTADASHQMRTPLSILRTHIALLRDGDANAPDTRRSIEDIADAGERLERLLVQLLALARADNAQSTPIAREALGINRLVADIFAQLAPRAVNADMDLDFLDADGDPQVMTNPVLAGELLANLIDNAIRYNRPRGAITVSVKPDHELVWVSIEDQGPGIPEADRAKVFTRFARLDRDADKPGSGLGLPIAARLSAVLDARIVLDSGRDGVGLRARIGFPSA